MPSQFIDVESQYRLNENLKKEDVMMLKEWLKLQPHLPDVSELQLILFLHSNYYSNEATKKCIDNYYTARSHCPEFFQNRDPKYPQNVITGEASCVAALPKLTNEGYGIFYTQLVNFSVDVYNFNCEVKLFDMLFSITSRQVGCLEGHIVVINMKGGTFSHMTKVNLSSLKKFLFFVQEALPLRLKAVHFINPVGFMDKVLTIMKPFLKKELQELLHIHSTVESLFKLVPKECLPQEIGGTIGTVAEIQANMKKLLADNADFLIEDEKNKTDENKRVGKSKAVTDIFAGVAGTFKKLDID